MLFCGTIETGFCLDSYEFLPINNGVQFVWLFRHFLRQKYAKIKVTDYGWCSGRALGSDHGDPADRI